MSGGDKTEGDGKLDAKATADILKEWREEINKLQREIVEAISKLDKIRENYEGSVLSFLKGNLAIIVVLLVALILFLSGVFIDCFKVDLGNIKIEKPCTNGVVEKPEVSNKKDKNMEE